MSVSAQHQEYSKYLPKWKRCRDVAAGQDAVHAAGEAYLPRLKEQEQADYDSYVTRATFFNATWRTLSGLLGMLFRKPTKFDMPAVTLPLTEAITSDGVPIQIFLTKIAEEALLIGRVGIFVDAPVKTDNIRTLADAKLANIRPTMALYEAESIINWRTTVINNTRVLSMVVLVENTELAVDEFASKYEVRYRVLDLEPASGYYRVRIYKVEGENDIMLNEFFPVMNNKPFSFIPFYFISSDDTDSCVDDPPMIDLVDMNLAHYRVTADYEHGCHFTGLPTGYITGHAADTDTKIYLGSQTMIVLREAEAKIGFLELTGTGLVQLKDNLERKEGQMAVLGARMLEQQKRAVETAETASIHRSGEQSVLASTAQSVSIGFKAALQTFSDWAGANGPVDCDINKDFFPMPMDPQALTALVAAWLQGGLDKESLFEQLKRGELVDPDMTFEEFEQKILNQYMTQPTGGDQ